MKMATYSAESGTVAVQGIGDQSRTFGPGSRVDLDEVVVAAGGTRKAQTMGDALGAYIHLFEVDAPVKPAKKVADSKPESV